MRPADGLSPLDPCGVIPGRSGGPADPVTPSADRDTVTERIAQSMKRVALAAAATLALMLVPDIWAAVSAASFGESCPGPSREGMCVTVVASDLGPVHDVAVTGAGDVYVLGADATITGRRPSDGSQRVLAIDGVTAIEAGFDSLFVASGDGVRRHRLGDSVGVVDESNAVTSHTTPTGVELGRLGRLFVTAECGERCSAFGVHDALSPDATAGRELSTTAVIDDLTRMPGSDLMIGAVQSGSGVELAVLGDHRKGCESECGLGHVPGTGDTVDMASTDRGPGGEPGLFVATGRELWFVPFDGTALGEWTPMRAFSDVAPVLVDVADDGSLYVVDTTGTVWRVWA